DLVDDDEWRSLALLVYAAAHMMLGDTARADDLLADAFASARRAGLGALEVVAASERMLLAEETHEHARVEAEAAAIAHLLASTPLQTSAPCAIELAAFARARLRRGSWEEARTL